MMSSYWSHFARTGDPNRHHRTAAATAVNRTPQQQQQQQNQRTAAAAAAPAGEPSPFAAAEAAARNASVAAAAVEEAAEFQLPHWPAYSSGGGGGGGGGQFAQLNGYDAGSPTLSTQAAAAYSQGVCDSLWERLVPDVSAAAVDAQVAGCVEPAAG